MSGIDGGPKSPGRPRGRHSNPESAYTKSTVRAEKRAQQGGKGARELQKEKERAEKVAERHRLALEKGIKPGTKFTHDGYSYTVEYISQDTGLVRAWRVSGNNVRVRRDINPRFIQEILSQPDQHSGN